MAIEGMLMQTCRIRRHSESVVGQELVKGSPTVIAENVECHIQPVADAKTITIMGKAHSQSYAGVFAPGTDLQENDLVDTVDLYTGVEFQVDGLVKPKGFDVGEEHHVEALLSVKEV